MSNRIEYASQCPVCAGEGEKNSIGFDMDKSEYCCIAGHTFADAEGGSIEKINSAESDGGIEKINTQKPTETASEIAEKPTENGEKSNDGEPGVCPDFGGPPPAYAEAAFAEILAKRQAAEAGISATVTDSLGAYGRGLGASAAVRLPGGDEMVCLRIEERWVNAIKAEAEIQGKPWVTYLEEWLNGMALEWQWGTAVK